MRALFVVFISAVCASVLPPAAAQEGIAVPPGKPVAGVSQANWSKACSFDPRNSPIADPTGENCRLKQNGPVWFLAGTYGTRRTVRTCTVPGGKYVFFPLINYVVMPNSVPGLTCESAVDTARSITDEPTSLVVDLDGHRLAEPAKYRQATKQCFDMGTLAEPRYRIFPSAANGYYVMLRPLSRGKHELNFGGALPGMMQAVTYTLVVE